MCSAFASRRVVRWCGRPTIPARARALSWRLWLVGVIAAAVMIGVAAIVWDAGERTSGNVATSPRTPESGPGTSRPAARGVADKTSRHLLPRRRDVDGDGRADFVVSTRAGAAVVFGSARRGDVHVSELGQGGFEIAAPVGGSLREPTIVGDLDGDGLADIGVSDGDRDGIGYLVFGKRDSGLVDPGANRAAATEVRGVGVWDDHGRFSRRATSTATGETMCWSRRMARSHSRGSCSEGPGRTAFVCGPRAEWCPTRQQGP